MRQCALFLCVLLLAGGMLSCGKKAEKQDPYGIVAWTEALERFNRDMQKVEDAGDYADAINTYTDALEPLIPRFQKLRKHYPSFNFKHDPPKGVDPEIAERFTVAFGAMFKHSMKMLHYNNDPEVIRAQKRSAHVQAALMAK